MASDLLPSEPVGNIPRPKELIAKYKQFDLGRLSPEELTLTEATALSSTISDFEATGSPVITDGEQRKAIFLAYPLRGVQNLTGGAFGISPGDTSFHALPKLTAGPFRYGEYAVDYLRAAKAKTSLPVKQAVVSASAVSLAYPPIACPAIHASSSFAMLLMKWNATSANV